MPICAALIHRSLERLEGKLRAETSSEAAGFGINQEKIQTGSPLSVIPTFILSAYNY